MNSCAGSVFTGGLVTDISTSCYAGRPRDNILPNITQGIGLRASLGYIVVAQRLAYACSTIIPTGLYSKSCNTWRRFIETRLYEGIFVWKNLTIIIVETYLKAFYL